jgi:hypothetical protein
MLGAAAAALGCAKFANPSTVVDSRFLAVAAEPSEIILDPQNPTNIPAVTLTPLVPDPRGQDRPLAFMLRACPNDPLGAQPPGAKPTSFPGGGVDTSVGSTRCPSDGPLSWPLAAPAAKGGATTVSLSAEQLQQAFAADPHAAELGLPINFELSVSTGTETAVAIKRVLFWRQPIDARQRPNVSPEIKEVWGFRDRAPETQEPIAPQMWGAGQPLQAAPGEELWIQPRGADAESYVTAVRDESGQVVPRVVAKETLRYAFFASAGTFEPLETSSALPAGFSGQGPVHVESRYTAPRPNFASIPVDPMTGRRQRTITLWIVVRDERGGCSWAERQLIIAQP